MGFDFRQLEVFLATDHFQIVVKSLKPTAFGSLQLKVLNYAL